MIRKAFMMTLKPGQQEEYEKRHNPIRHDLHETLKRHGVHNYSIFLDRGTDKLFAYVELESEQLWQQIAEAPSCRRWWEYMSELMETNSDSSPVTLFLDEVFHLD